MTNRERQNATLGFKKVQNRGCVLETFHPWDLTIERFKSEGLPLESSYLYNEQKYDCQSYLNDLGTRVEDYETYMGFDSLKRIMIMPPFSRETIKDESDWEKVKKVAIDNIEKYYSDECIKDVFTPYVQGHKNGDYAIRMSVLGFFWIPRDLFGIEEHLYAFFDYPELMHEINSFLLKFYLDKLPKILDIIPADVLYIMEDLSGKNGPMLSPNCFDEFIGDYYKPLIKMLKDEGVSNVLVDTDGDFSKLIPNFIRTGVEGFIPMDVNAGMDIVKIRSEYPNLKFIGAFNKLCIAEGKEAIDEEFERIMPVIKQGGYIPGADHQVAPSTSFENYKYYIEKLKIAMQQSGANI